MSPGIYQRGYSRRLLPYADAAGRWRCFAAATLKMKPPAGYAMLTP